MVLLIWHMVGKKYAPNLWYLGENTFFIIFFVKNSICKSFDQIIRNSKFKKHKEEHLRPVKSRIKIQYCS